MYTNVPRFCTGYHQVFFDGDQVTRERVTGAQDAKLQSDEEKHRLRGVMPQSADWHAQVCFLQELYDEQSSFLAQINVFRGKPLCDSQDLYLHS